MLLGLAASAYLRVGMFGSRHCLLDEGLTLRDSTFSRARMVGWDAVVVVEARRGRHVTRIRDASVRAILARRLAPGLTIPDHDQAGVERAGMLDGSVTLPDPCV